MSDVNESMQPTTTIHHLNDYVVRKIFSNLIDFELCVVAKVCSDFKRNATFSLRHKRFDIVVVPWKNYLLRLKRLPPLFREFRSLMVSIDIYSDASFCNLFLQVLEMIGQYCGETLTELRQCTFTADVVSKLWPLLT